jgi:hypothetical protein
MSTRRTPHPWIFEGQLFVVKELDGFTLASKMKFDTVALWIRMYDLSMVCMEREMGFKLGSTVGKGEKVDTMTSYIAWVWR